MTIPVEPEPKSLEVCFSPKLFSEILTTGPFIVVLADILRATTSICTAFENGVREIIPVADLNLAREMKEQGYLVASEQDGRKLPFADFGNSAYLFTREKVEGKSLVYCTTNGTRALDIAKTAGRIAIGSFINLTALTGWLVRQHQPVVILCSGWKNKFCLEDALFAGALSFLLLRDKSFQTQCDSAFASMDLWSAARPDPLNYIRKAMHRKRLQDLGLDDVIPYSFTIDQTRSVPVYENGRIRDLQLND